MLKNKPVELINYSYMVTAVIILIMCYSFMKSTKQKLHMKKIDKYDIQQKTITVQTKKGEIVMDPNVFEMHMKRVKDNIVELNKNFSVDDCSGIKKYLDRTKKNTKSYINSNTNGNSDFCDLDSGINLMDDHVLQERNALKKKLAKTTESDSTADTRADRAKYSILEILIDIDIILFLVRSSLCKNGKLDLSSMDSLLLELYKTNCVSAESKKINHKIDEISHNYIEPTKDLTFKRNEGFHSKDKNRVGYKGHTINRLSGSQSMVDGQSVFYENRMLKQPNKRVGKSQRMKIDNNLLISHERQPMFIDNINNGGVKFAYEPHKLINDLHNWDHIPNEQHIDRTSRTSLGS
jgi:hypothetical protein